MIYLGLNSSNQDFLNKLYARNHLVRPVLSMMDLNHSRIGDISSMFGDGQVTIDADAEINRSCTLTLFDPKYKLALDSASPHDGALFLDRMIAVYLVVQNIEQTWQATVPVFCGPLTKMDRDSAFISVEAQGKELFGVGEAWRPRTYYKGALKTDVIRSILSTYMGEPSNRMSIPTSTSRLPYNIAISNESKPWNIAKWIAGGMGYQLFYDARGTAVMRPWPRSPIFTFREDAGGMILSKPQVGYDVSNLINAVHVRGATPKGKTSPITYSAVAPSSHPLSPTALGRGGAPRWHWKKIEDTNIESAAEAKAVADAELAKGLMIATTISFDSLPHPQLEPYDLTTLNTSEFVYSFPLRKYTIPLLASGKSTVGYLRNSSVNKARIRRAR